MSTHVRDECVAPTHDHTTLEDGQGGTLIEAIPMVCLQCGLPTHYDTTIETYQHDDVNAPDCFLIARDDSATACDLDMPTG